MDVVNGFPDASATISINSPNSPESKIHSGSHFSSG